MAEELDNTEMSSLLNDNNSIDGIDPSAEIEDVPKLNAQDLRIQQDQQIMSDIAVERDLVQTQQFLMGADISFSAKQHNVDKYLTYDSDVYGKLGFDPFLSSVKQADGTYKSGMDTLYDDNTTSSDDIGRAMDGMWELTKIGFQDTFALGVFHDDENYIEFEDVMAKYSSSKGGQTGFWSNTMLSSGYTMGIIAGIAAEELAITALTGGLGAIGGASTIAGSRAFKFLSKGSKARKGKNMINAAEEMMDVGKATTWLGRRKAAFGKGARNFGKAINPIGETMDFIKNIDRVKDFNGLKATALGAGSVVRDMRKIYMSHSESELEANMAEADFRKKNYDDFYLDYTNLDKYGNPTKKNVGVLMDKAFTEKLDAEAKRVNKNVYAGNFGLIYLTNAVTFDNMFKHMKGTGRMFGNSANNMFKAVRDPLTKKVTVNAIKKSAGEYIRGKVADWTIGGTIKKSVKGTLSGSMEGVQELGQDILSESFKNYHSRNVQGTQTKGGLMHYLNNDLMKAVNKQNSHQGLETFASGLFMGVFASPVGFATGQINTFVNGGGFIYAQGTFEKATNKAKYAETQKAEMDRLEKEAEFLTKFFNENKNFIDSWSKPIARQSEIQEEMLEAAKKGQKKEFKNAQNESFTNGVRRVIKAGLSEQMADHLTYMGTELGVKELSELMARTDITEENIGDSRKKLLDNAELLRNLSEKHKIIQQNFINDITLSELDPKADNYLEKFIEYSAFESLKDELLFNHSKILDRAKRLKEIKEVIRDQNPLVSEFSVESLVEVGSLDQTIQTLKAEVEANKDLNLTGALLQNAKISENRLQALENYKVVLTQTTELLNQASTTESEEEIYDGMFDVYQKVVEAFGKNRLTSKEAQTEVNKKAFDLIFDYIILEKQEGAYTEYAETLMTNSGSSSFMASHKLMLGRLEENKKEHIKNALIEFSKKQSSDAMLKELYDAGVFFDLKYLDDLLSNRVMPEEVINLENNEAASAEQTRIAEKIIDKYIKKLTGKNIVKSGLKKGSQGRKLKQDKRTVKGILRQYNIKIDKNIDITSKAGLKLINKILNVDNKYMTPIDREVMLKVMEAEGTIRFVEDQTLPIQVNEQGVITIDVRFAGEDYSNSAYSIENLVITALTQNKISEGLVENDDLWLQARDAMRQAKEVYAATYPEQDVENMPVFNSVNVFLSEALNDSGFQYFLSKIEDTIQPTKKTLWATVKEGGEAIIKEKFENKLVNKVINIAAKAVDQKIVDDISEINIKLRTDEATEALDKKEAELKVLGAELGAKWNVNVKILRDQEEAESYLDKIKNPFYSKESGIPNGFYDEKTNTAYIVAEGVKENTPFHEIFLHPFLINAEKKNPELYKALVAEARADQSVIEYVEAEYGTEESIGSRQFEHELVGRVYELAMANQISEKEKPGLFEKIYEFAKMLIKETAKFLKILPKDVSKFKPTKTTIADLAKYSAKGDAIDLGSIIEGTEEVKPKKEKIKVTKTKTTEVKENVGGNTVVMAEARDQPGLLEDFINDDIQFENADSVNAATDELVALGKELDELDVLADEMNWEFGPLRLEIDGRLIIDVVANGKRFLMYKSTGTGTTADTAGEWTPLLYFGTKLKKDGSGRKEWFVKALFEGQDPKKNKYNSKTFIGLDSLLKEQESELFTGLEQIQTRTETEEIEVEEEVIKETKVDSDVRTVQSIQDEIDNLRAQIKINEDNLKIGKGTFIEKRRLSTKTAMLKIKVLELSEERKKLAEEQVTENAPVLEKNTDYVPEFDRNKNEIITPFTPFARLPKELQNTIADLYGKPITALEQKDIDAIAEMMQTNPLYIEAASKYSADRIKNQDEQEGSSEIKLNQEKIDRAKAKRKEDMALEKLNKKGKKTKLTLEEKIKQLPGAELLTDREIKKFVKEIRNQKGIIAFSFLDIRNIITGRLRIQREAEEKIQEEERLRKEKIIADNLKRLGNSGKYELKILNMKDKIINIPNGMREFMLKYHSEIFLLEQNEFNERVRDIMRTYRSETKPNQISTLLPGFLRGKTELETYENAQKLIAKLEKNQRLYPSVVIKLNRLLNESGIAYTLKKLSAKQLINSTSLYELRATPNKKFGKDAIVPVKQTARTIIKKADIENIAFTIETKAAIVMAKILLFHPSTLKKLPPTYWSTELLREKYSAWISNDPEKQINIKSPAGLGEKIEEGLSELLYEQDNDFVRNALDRGSNVPGLGIAESLMADNFTPNELAEAVAMMIDNDIAAYEAMKAEDELSSMTEEDAALMEWVEWSTTQEGKAIIEAEILSKEQDYLLAEEMLNEEYAKELSAKEKSVDYVSEYGFSESISAQLLEIDSVNMQLKLLWKLINTENQSDLNFIKSFYTYTSALNKLTTAKQKTAIQKSIDSQFESGNLKGAVININGTAYIINDYREESNKIEIVLLEEFQSGMVGDVMALNSQELLSVMTEELLPGTIFNGQVIDVVANATEFQYIKEAYSEILSNFTKYNKEAESLSDEQLLEDLKTEITKCK